MARTTAHLKSFKELTPVKVKDMRNGYVVKKPKNATGYVILPTVYAKVCMRKSMGKKYLFTKLMVS